MPIYEYKCKKGHVFEVMQSFSDEPLTKCEVCGAPVQQVFHPVSVHFKGSASTTPITAPSAARARRKETRSRLGLVVRRLLLRRRRRLDSRLTVGRSKSDKSSSSSDTKAAA